ncbi:MAG: TonB family protein [Pyrinomonadaceae bacterium]
MLKHSYKYIARHHPILMKYCPTCNTRYDEEVLRFCMKDGTPLLEEEEPKFSAMPSESLDEPVDEDAGDVTVVRRNIPVPPEREMERPRIVVPTYEESREQPRVRIAPLNPQRKSNTAKIVVLTILGTLAVLGAVAAGFFLLRRDNSANSNLNANVNTNVNANTNLGIDTNFNFNVNGSFNSNTNASTNVNTNVKTPTPTPRPSPSASATPSPTPKEDVTPTPTRSPIPTPQPTIIRPGASPSPRPVSTPNRNVNGGILNGMAVNLPRPIYPPMAKQIGASGEVRVQVVVDGNGNVVSARAVTGHPLLRSAAESAARQSKMRPNGADIIGQIVYNFRNN